jgi:hypothetical protein
MVCAMGLAKQYLPGKVTPELGFFDDETFRKVVVSIVRSLGPEYWRNYGNFSEQMRAEAYSHFFAAGTDAVGIVVGEGLGKASSKFLKAAKADKIIRPYRKTLAKVGPKARYRVSINRFAENNLPYQINISKGGKDLFTLSGYEFVGNLEYGVASEIAQECFTHGDSFSYGEQINKGIDRVASFLPFEEDTNKKISKVASVVVDVGTDFIPVLGNAKALVSAATNVAIGYEYSKSAKRIEKLEIQGVEADRKFFSAYLFVDIEKDLKAMDKTTLYKMWLFASNYYIQLCNRK